MTHEYFMKQAIEQAKIAFERGEVPIGAVIVCNEKIIARSHNLTQTLNDPTAHAEMQAITSATNFIGGKYLNQCSLYVTVEPCPMCAGALYWSHIAEIVFGTGDEKRGYRKISSNILSEKTKVTGGILQSECENLMKSFFDKLRDN